MALLTRAEIETALRDLPGWSYERNSLTKLYTFAGFPEAVAFVNRLVPGSEATDHHPDLAISYRRVTVMFSTHSTGGVTEKDIAGARLADQCA
ncbi:MAG: 4a-hydroxytetrahydrobiopterin dehydratase [Acidobacteria bacterium]|nr:4a-hydroxytetrahydrobiopterin dehydratase [Acidobacteriota bacterium]